MTNIIRNIKGQFIKGEPGIRKGRKNSDEHRRKISMGNKGNKLSEERKIKISNALKGKKRTEEQKKRMSIAFTGRKLSEEHKNKMRIARLGKKHSDATKLLMNISQKKVIHKPPSKETKQKISDSLKGRYGGDKNPMYGKKHSDVIRKKISENVKGKVVYDDERRAKLSKSNSGSGNPFWGRKHKPETIERIKEARKKQVGDKHPRWISDRENVKRAKAFRHFILNCLRLNLKSNVSDELLVRKLGYTKQEFYDHFSPLLDEKGWTEGMCWENHGRKGWHIDHIKPISAFVKEGITDPKIINALDNLQPLWCTDNLKKGCKY